MTARRQHQVPGHGDHLTALGRGAHHRDPPAATEFEQALFTELAQGPQDGVAVDPENGGQVDGRRQAVARPALAVGDGAPDLGRYLFVERDRFIEIDLDGRYRAMFTGSGSGPPPCDATVPGTAVIDGVTTNVEQIINGGRATVRLSSASSSVAHGVISGSTDPSQVPNGPATFTVTATDLLSVTPTATFGPSALSLPLCGPQAAALSVTEQEAKGINCGA